MKILSISTISLHIQSTKVPFQHNTTKEYKSYEARILATVHIQKLFQIIAELQLSLMCIFHN